jgi:ribosome biogenesis protein ERB1
MDDPNYWRTIKDRYTGKEIVLTDEELDMIEKMQKSDYVQLSDPYKPYEDYFTHETMMHPLTNKPESKRSFVPSKWENQKISKIISAIKKGWITMRPGPKKARLYMLWSDTDKPEQRKHQMHIPAPKMKLPGHEESYNPPPEYLPTEEEIKKWKDTDPEDRERNFLPQKYASLREVPAYPKYINERFERCLDLYLCPRKLKMRVKLDDPDRLLPNLPKPKDLQPFPTTESIVYRGHSGMVRCIAVGAEGQWIASGSDDGTVRLWEVDSGRCMKTLQVDGTPHSVAFNPSRDLSLLAISVASKVYVINHGMDDRLVSMTTDTALSTATTSGSSNTSGSSSVVEWMTESEENKREEGFRFCLSHPKPVKQVVWHSKGDYFATVMPEGGSLSVQIHQISKWRTQNPFQKSKGLIQKVAFHPSKPLFFVATQRYVRVYDLSKLELKKKLFSGVKWISSIDIHPQGDNLIIGSYDKRICWFDLDLSAKPYRILRHHSQAVRQVCYHKRYPLFASCSDDGSATICHGMVYSDLLQNALIVPVKVLKGHGVVNKLGVLDCQFHPTQPWIFTAGADSTVRLYT